MSHARILDAAGRRLMSALDQADCQPRTTGPNGMKAKCPAHEDRHPSLSVTGVEGRVLVHCHTGCATEDVVAALGISMADLFDQPRVGARYRYTDRNGNRTRTVTRTPDKQFRQSGRTRDTPEFYRLPQVLRSVKNGQPVWLVEGENDVGALETLGVVATTAPMGASNFGKVDASPLRGAEVVAVVDRDDAGCRWATDVRRSLDGLVSSLMFVQAVQGKDAADHVAAGHGLDEFQPFDLPAAEVERSDDIPEELDDEPHRRARITWASEIEPEPVTWAWTTDDGLGRMPAGALSLAAGREGTGKSSFGIWLAAQITRGTLPGSFLGAPRNVFYVAVEDSWRHTLVPRLLAAGADLSRVGRFEVLLDEDTDVILSLPQDNSMFEREIARLEVALVVIDPVMSVMSAALDTHKEREVRTALDPLAKIADRTGSVIFGLAHFNKSAGSDVAQLVTGSGAFKNVPRAVFGFARDDSEERSARVMSQVKNSLGRDDLPDLAYAIESTIIPTRSGPAETGKFVFLGESDRSVAEVLRANRSGPEDEDDRSAHSEAATWLLAHLQEQGGQSLARDVIRAANADGIARSTLDRARRRAGVTSSKQAMTKGWLWSIDPRRTHEDPQEPGLKDVRPSGPSVSSSQGEDRWEPGEPPPLEEWRPVLDQDRRTPTELGGDAA